eukprot:SAG31_NODE_69_length_28130_cov_15.318219_6_plen_86_part_00
MEIRAIAKTSVKGEGSRCHITLASTRSLAHLSAHAFACAHTVAVALCGVVRCVAAGQDHFFGILAAEALISKNDLGAMVKTKIDL